MNSININCKIKAKVSKENKDSIIETEFATKRFFDSNVYDIYGELVEQCLLAGSDGKIYDCFVKIELRELKNGNT